MVVNVVKIIENFNGIIKVETASGDASYVHITSELCHRLGWSANNFEHVEPCKDNEFTNGDLVPVPAWIFESNVLKEHKFEVGTPTKETILLGWDVAGGSRSENPDDLLPWICLKSLQ